MTTTIARRTQRVLGSRAVRFLAIGAVTTLVYAWLFAALRPGLGATGANLVAFLLTAFANTEGHRRYTFASTTAVSLWRAQAEAGLVLVLGLVITSGSLLLLERAVASPSSLVEGAVLVAANVLAAALHYVLLRAWVFGGNQPPVRDMSTASLALSRV